MKISHHTVRDKHRDWGEFFVAEREPVANESGRIQYTATWTCYSSFGTFGHHWYSMGEPFAKFIQDVDCGYLLSKIARRVTNGDKACDEIARLIREARREKRITAEVARVAMDDVKSIKDEGADGTVTCHRLYESVPISRVQIEWCDLSTQEWERSAVMFAERIWPEFVKVMKAADEPVAA